MRTTVATIVLAAVYVAAARFGLQLDAVGGFATLVWPPTGIAIAALLLLDKRVAVGVFGGAFIANFWTGASIPVALGIASGNTLEALFAMFALTRVPQFHASLRRPRDVVAFVLLGAACAPVVSATIGVASLSAGGVLAGGDVSAAWRAWWLGDAIGALVVAPLLLTWATQPRGGAGGRLEELVLACAAVGGGLAVFASETASLERPYLLFPLLIWSAVRFGTRGAATSGALVSSVAIAMTALGHGPFAASATTLRDSLWSLQLFIAFTAVVFLMFGAVAVEATKRQLALADALQETRVARAQAEGRSAFKTDLLHLVAHELRTPLAALRLQLEQLQRGGELPADKKALVPRMLAQTSRLTELIDALLHSARIESGRLDVAAEPVDVAKLCADVVDELRPQADARNIELKIDAPPQPPLSTDPRLLRLIVVNLVGNAIKFTPEGHVALQVTATGDARQIVVEDTGPGIPAESRQRIFEPFERAAGTTQRHVTGIGLGLALVRTLSAALNASISVESEEGKGSRFTVVVPPFVKRADG